MTASSAATQFALNAPTAAPAAIAVIAVAHAAAIAVATAAAQFATDAAVAAAATAKHADTATSNLHTYTRCHVWSHWYMSLVYVYIIEQFYNLFSINCFITITIVPVVLTQPTVTGTYLYFPIPFKTKYFTMVHI